MNAKLTSTSSASIDQVELPPGSRQAPIVAGLLAWAAISIGFYGLKLLMHERPEFVGPPMHATQAELLQESPRMVIRKLGDDVAAIKPAQPSSSVVSFDLRGRRDYRGLRTTLDMSGEFRANYTLTNDFAEAAFVLFSCPHPRAENSEGSSLLAGDLKLAASVDGMQENTKDAWVWSGTLAPHGTAQIEISYHVAALEGVTYRASDVNGNQIEHLRVAVHRQDLTALHFESGDGPKLTDAETVAWERRDFLGPETFTARIYETRNLFVSLSQLLQIGPVVSFLFLLTVAAIVLTRQSLSVVQMFTIAAGYALYFPLILYLSVRFQFMWALVIAFVVPGALLVNYSRWLVGGKLGLAGAAGLLALYQVFPTLAAFAGWNRGLLLLCLGVVTLGVVINLQNQSLRKKVAKAATLLLLLLPTVVHAENIQVILPAELATKLAEPRPEVSNSVVGFHPITYQVRQEADFFQVAAEIQFQAVRAGTDPILLFALPVFLQEAHIETEPAELAQLLTVTNRLALFVQRPGTGTLQLTYRVPILNREGKQRAQIPVICGTSGSANLESSRDDLEILTGHLWNRSADGRTNRWRYQIGVTGQDSVLVEWRDQVGSRIGTATKTEAAKDFYGIGITRAQHLTVVNSDGSCTHFAEFEVPAVQKEEFRLRLPPNARLLSASVNGTEISSPVLDEQLCRVRLPSRENQQTAHQLSFRIAYPVLRLGFVGVADLVLPEVFQTAGTLEWVVVLPTGFETQVISSGLERQKTPPNLNRFGDYGRILQSHVHTSFAKDLAPPGPVGLSLKYRQAVAGFYEPHSE